jgi:hypothetical protein
MIGFLTALPATNALAHRPGGGIFHNRSQRPAVAASNRRGIETVRSAAVASRIDDVRDLDGMRYLSRPARE